MTGNEANYGGTPLGKGGHQGRRASLANIQGIKSKIGLWEKGPAPALKENDPPPSAGKPKGKLWSAFRNKTRLLSAKKPPKPPATPQTTKGARTEEGPVAAKPAGGGLWGSLAVAAAAAGRSKQELGPEQLAFSTPPRGLQQHASGVSTPGGAQALPAAQLCLSPASPASTEYHDTQDLQEALRALSPATLAAAALGSPAAGGSSSRLERAPLSPESDAGGPMLFSPTAPAAPAEPAEAAGTQLPPRELAMQQAARSPLGEAGSHQASPGSLGRPGWPGPATTPACAQPPVAAAGGSAASSRAVSVTPAPLPMLSPVGRARPRRARSSLAPPQQPPPQRAAGVQPPASRLEREESPEPPRSSGAEGSPQQASGGEAPRSRQRHSPLSRGESPEAAQEQLGDTAAAIWQPASSQGPPVRAEERRPVAVWTGASPLPLAARGGLTPGQLLGAAAMDVDSPALSAPGTPTDYSSFSQLAPDVLVCSHNGLFSPGPESEAPASRAAGSVALPRLSLGPASSPAAAGRQHRLSERFNVERLGSRSPGRAASRTPELGSGGGAAVVSASPQLQPVQQDTPAALPSEPLQQETPEGLLQEPPLAADLAALAEAVEAGEEDGTGPPSGTWEQQARLYKVAPLLADDDDVTLGDELFRRFLLADSYISGSEDDMPVCQASFADEWRHLLEDGGRPTPRKPPPAAEAALAGLEACSRAALLAAVQQAALSPEQTATLCQALAPELMRLQRVGQKADEEANQLAGTVADTRAELAAERYKADKLQEELGKLHGKYAEQKEGFQLLHSEKYLPLKQQAAELQGALEAAQAEAASLAQEKASLETQCHDLESQKEELLGMCDELLAKLEHR